MNLKPLKHLNINIIELTTNHTRSDNVRYDCFDTVESNRYHGCMIIFTDETIQVFC